MLRAMMSGNVAQEFIVSSFLVVLFVFICITIWTFKLHDRKLLNEKASIPFNDGNEERRDLHG